MSPTTRPETIDIHIHFGAPAGDPAGCFWSESFEASAAYLMMRWISGTVFGPITGERVRKYLARLLATSRLVDKGVLLGLDLVYDPDGTPRPEATGLYVPNACVRDLAAANPRFLWGASVHPYRLGAADELEACVRGGAVLCKWLPSAQAIDPESPLCDAAYRTLARRRLPLLCHVGPEGSIPPTEDWKRQTLNAPRRLRRALDAGVTVIAAHCALPLLPPPFGSEADLDELTALFEEREARGWKLYADVSALFLGTRATYIERVKSFGVDRLLFGSDYPIPILELGGRKDIGARHWLHRLFDGRLTKNKLDRNVGLLREHGFPDSVFQTAAGLFKDIDRGV